MSSLHYAEAGSGEPVVLVHGMGCDLHTWDAATSALAGQWRVLTPDLPGHGRSPKSYPAYTLDTFVGSLAQWVDALQTGPVHVVGHSFGGAVTVGLALARPDLVRSVGMVSAARLSDHRPTGKILRAFLAFGLAQVFGRPSRAATRRFLERGFGVRPDQVTSDLVALWQVSHAASHRAVVAAQRALRGPHTVLFNRLPELRVPAWLLWGTRDPLFPGHDNLTSIVRQFLQADLDLLDCGHLPMFEQPEPFVKRLTVHLRTVETHRALPARPPAAPP